MGLVAGEIGLSLIELSLKGARIQLGQEVAFLDELAILEVDADDLLRDHAANGRCVERRHVTDPGQYNREVLRLDCCCDDGNWGRGFRLRGGRAVYDMLPTEVAPRDSRDHC